MREIIFIGLVIFMSLSSYPVIAATIDCINCSDCSEKIKNATAGDTIRLTEDIFCPSGHCIDFNIFDFGKGGQDEIIFDGGDHVITGNLSERYQRGIFMPYKSCDNIIRNVVIKDFYTGIDLDFCCNNTFKNVAVLNCKSYGIRSMYSNETVIKDSILQENGYYDFFLKTGILKEYSTSMSNVTGTGGDPILFFYNQPVDLHDRMVSMLFLYDCGLSCIDNVTVTANGNNGVIILHTDDSMITNVTASDLHCGVRVAYSDRNILQNIVGARNDADGIQVIDSKDNIFSDIVAYSNHRSGLYMYYCEDNYINGATLCYNNKGMDLRYSSRTSVSDSIIIDNYEGIRVSGTQNQIYNNYLDNAVNAIAIHPNSWNVAPTETQNIVGGPSIGGNYWSDYPGVDDDNDGFGDASHQISGGDNRDYYPLIHGMCGDVDRNGYVSVNDVVETYLRVVDPGYVVGSAWAADADGTWYISANDVIEIYMAAVNPDRELHCVAFTHYVVYAMRT